MRNVHQETVDGFGDEWSAFSQENLSDEELQHQFDSYFSIFDWSRVGERSIGFDMGCGSGRWAKLVAPRVGQLYCIDASEKALAVAKRNLKDVDNCKFFTASFEELPMDNDSMDFGYCLGVLHHIPDTSAGIKSCVSKLKSGAPFLAYIYYAFDNKPAWFQTIWKCSDLLRRFISALPFRARWVMSQIIAGGVYYPLARMSSVLEAFGVNVDNIPLSAYRNLSFYSMRTDALDRFGTSLEKRFSREEISMMFTRAGLEKITFHDGVPYWCVIGYKA
jgi:ubiquinone/menaquinone biosynthesis C-methylase UbiE